MYILLVFLLVVFMGMMFFISFLAELEDNKISIYECGFDPVKGSRLNFSYRFFLISILFLIFDVEISLMLPIPYLMENSNVGNVLVFFLGLLLLGVLFEYNNGVLSWM